MRRSWGWLGVCVALGCGAATEGSAGAADGGGGTAEVAERVEVAAEPDALRVDAGCTPVCGDKTCGDDGCGGVCGKCGPTQECAADQCVEQAVACVPADTATCGSVVTGISLASAEQATSAFSAFGACTAPGESYPGAEVVIQFVASEDQVVSLDGFPDASVFVLEDDGSGCHVGAACVAHAVSTGTFKAAKDTIYYFVFEGSADTQPFDLDVACCVPQCGGKTCGGDGCGGSCGTCPIGQVCSSGACLDVSAAVSPKVMLACGTTAVGLSATDAAMASDVFDTYLGCSTQTFDSPEVVAYYYGGYVDTVVTLTTGVDAFLVSAPTYESPGGMCLAPLAGGQSFRAVALQGYWIAFEGGAAGAKPFDVGVSCCYPSCGGVSCDDGCGGTCNLCEGGYCDGSACVPFKASCTPKQAVTCGDLMLGQNVMTPSASVAFSTYECPESGGWEPLTAPEVVYTFVSTVDQRVSLIPPGEPFSRLSGLVAIFEDTGEGCAGAAAACVTWSEFPVFDAKAGSSYYVIWEAGAGDNSPPDRDFEFQVSCCVTTCVPGSCGVDDGCGGSCGCDSDTQKCGAGNMCEPLGKGESCADPFVLSSATLPTTVTGDVSFSGSQFSSGAYACSVGPDLGASGNDHVYSFTAPEGAIYTFTATGDSGVVPYVLSSCVGAANADAACIEEVFQTVGQHYGEPVRVPMTAGETVFVVVDGGWWEAGGAYTLTVGAPCHPVCGGVTIQPPPEPPGRADR